MTTRPAALAAGHRDGDLDGQTFVNQFVDALRPGAVLAALDALDAAQQDLVRDWVDGRELWTRRDDDVLWPLAGGRAVEEELLRWRFASAAGPAADRFAAGELDPADVPALLAALDRSANLRRPEPAARAAA